VYTNGSTHTMFGERNETADLRQQAPLVLWLLGSDRWDASQLANWGRPPSAWLWRRSRKRSSRAWQTSTLT
jgi:hypothetical protein